MFINYAPYYNEYIIKGGVYVLKNIGSFTLAIVLFLSLQLTSTAASHAPVTSWKDWTVTFSQDVSKNDSNLDAITIQSANEKQHDASVNISANSSKVVVKPTKPYIFGEKYTLVIPKEVRSAAGKALKKEERKEFSVESDYIESIETNYTALLTNILVTPKSADVRKIDVGLIDSTNTDSMIRGKKQFTKGIFGLSRGQTLELVIYDENNQVLEELYYEVK